MFGSPLITESPGLETGLSKSGYVSLNDSEKQFLEPICSAYRLFFPDHKLNPTLKKNHCFKARSIPRILSVRYCCVCLKRLLQRLLRNWKSNVSMSVNMRIVGGINLFIILPWLKSNNIICGLQTTKYLGFLSSWKVWLFLITLRFSILFIIKGRYLWKKVNFFANY